MKQGSDFFYEAFSVVNGYKNFSELEDEHMAAIDAEWERVRSLCTHAEVDWCKEICVDCADHFNSKPLYGDLP